MKSLMGVFGGCYRSVRTLWKLARSHAAGHGDAWSTSDDFHFELVRAKLKRLL